MSSAHAYQAQQVTGEFQPLGYYEVTTDADYVAPADASFILWNVPAQSQPRNADFSNIAEGQFVAIRVVASNGENVVGPDVSFTLNDTTRSAAIIQKDLAGNIYSATGIAGQYDVGTSGSTIPLNSDVVHIAGTETITGLKTITNQLRVNSSPTEDVLYLKGGPGGLGSPAGLAFDATGVPFGSNVSARINFIDDGAFGADIVFANRTGSQGFTTTERMRLTTAGRLGIGTSTPDGLLDVAGTTKLGPDGSSTVFGGKRVELATMAAGTTGAIADTTITAGSTITLSPGFAPAGTLYYTKTAGVGFTILSTNAGDAGEVSWERTIL